MFYNYVLCVAAKCPSPVLRQATDTQQSVLTSVQQEMAARRQHKAALARQDSRLSVKSLIESIENATKQAKAGPGSRSSSTSSLNSLAGGELIGVSPAASPVSPTRPGEWTEAALTRPLREQQPTANKTPRSNSKTIITGELPFNYLPYFSDDKTHLKFMKQFEKNIYQLKIYLGLFLKYLIFFR